MSTARDLIVDQLPPAADSGNRLTTWYAQGHSDGLGDRLLMFDNTTAPSWELLRFNPALARDPRFSTTLRHRMETLSTFQHPAFPVVRSIKEFGQDEGLAVVSTYVQGLRLSDALKKPRSTEFALHLLRQLMPALAALHEHAEGVVHGAVTLDRIVLTGDGKMTIREHMVGSAIEALEFSAPQLWSEFGILTPLSRLVCPPLDSRSDVAQLALVALSLMAGRRIVFDEYPHTIHEPLARVVRLASLRLWFERALYLTEHGFRSAREASEALSELKQDVPRAKTLARRYRATWYRLRHNQRRRRRRLLPRPSETTRWHRSGSLPFNPNAVIRMPSVGRPLLQVLWHWPKRQSSGG